MMKVAFAVIPKKKKKLIIPKYFTFRLFSACLMDGLSKFKKTKKKLSTLQSRHLSDREDIAREEIRKHGNSAIKCLL